MLRVIDLDIDGSLSADTGVFEVALVEFPAIEQNFIYFNKQKFETYNDYPQEATDNACRVLEWIDKYGRDEVDGMTEVGLARANQLCSREKLSEDTIARMSAFNRHRGNSEINPDFKGTPWKDKGYVAWLAWGGDAGINWAQNKLQKIRKTEEMDITPNPCYEGYEPYGLKPGKGGNLVPNCVPINQSKQEFIEKKPNESKDDYISRCVAYHIKNEDMKADQAYAICISKYENYSLQFLGEKISYDYDGTASTKRGKDQIHNQLLLGYDIYIISARKSKDEIVADLKNLAIPTSKIYATGSNQNKIEKIKSLGITKHYDNNPEVVKQLGTLGEKFDYDTSNLPSYQNTPTSGDTELIKPILTPVLFEEDCNCNKIEFQQVGYVDGFPVFSTAQEAEQYGENEYGCNGSHEHTDEDGNILYMACETHPTQSQTTSANIVGEDIKVNSVGQVENITGKFQKYFDQPQEDELEIINLLQFLKETDHQQFEAITGNLRGASLAELKTRNHKNPTPYYLYKRVLDGSPDRDFCMSIENRYFRRFEIDLLQDTNLEFGHEGQPYSKFLYKGGPNCVHAFYQVIAQGKKITEIGPAPGQAGIPPKRMKNNGYYSPETKRKSEVAYIISQQNSKNWEFYDWNNHDLTPSGYLNGFPVFQDSLLAQSAADIIGCGCYGSIMFNGEEHFQACLTTETKMEKQLFKAEEDKKMIYTPLMIPNILIPRMDEVSNERYFVRFTPEVIEKIQQKFMIEQRLKDTNYEHTDKKFSDIVMVESWIVSGDQDKAYSLGFTKKQIPKGTWMGGYKVLDTTEGNMIWRDYIKPGKVKGVSVEGDFLLNFSAQKTDEYLLEEIIKTINKIK